MKRTSATLTGGGASPDEQRSEGKNRQPAGKIMSKKGSTEAHGKSRKLVPGAPEIAHSHDGEKYRKANSIHYRVVS